MAEKSQGEPRTEPRAPGPRAPEPRTPEAVWRLARRLYERGVRQVDIAAQLDLNPSTLCGRAHRHGWKWPDGSVASQRGASRKKLVRRLYRAFERQVALLEARIGSQLPPLASPADAGGAFDERDVRLLATLAQTLQRLAGLEARHPGSGRQGSGKHGAAGGRGADAGKGKGQEAIDLDGFRRELARRLVALSAPAHRGAAGHAEPRRDRDPGA